MTDHLGNVLGIYSPYTREQVKSLRDIPQQMAWWDQWTSLFPGSKTDFKEQVNDLSKSSLIMSAIRWVSNALPEAPIQVKDPGRGQGDKEVVNDHSILNLLRQPNDFYAGDVLWSAFAYSWIMDGNCYFLKAFSDMNKAMGGVKELWYEPHWSITPRQLYDNLGYWIKGDTPDDPRAFINYYEVYRNGQRYRLEIGDVVHLRDGLDPKNPRKGLSYIGSIYRELYGDSEVSNYSARLFAGSAIPPFMVKIDPKVSFDQTKANELADYLERKTTGDNKQKPVVVYGGEPLKLSWSPNELDLKMLHRFSEERFCAVTGIPPEVLILGLGRDHSIYNNAKQYTAQAYLSYLKPLYRRIAPQLTLQLLRDFEDDKSKLYLTHDLSQVSELQDEKKDEWDRLGLAYQRGGIMRSEYRSGMGYGPSDPEHDPEGQLDRVFFDPRGGSIVQPGEDITNAPQGQPNGQSQLLA